MRGVDVGSGELAAEICSRAYDKGLVIETSGSEDQVVKVLAPLTTPEADLPQGVQHPARRHARRDGRTGP